jgi:uncharacterized cysteine cluster protein YcgN (CxxCxxCC family)
MSKTTTTDNLTHSDWCPRKRIDPTRYEDKNLTTYHCLDCGAHEAVHDERGKLTKPAVTGGLAGSGKDDWTVTMRRAPGGAV